MAKNPHLKLASIWHYGTITQEQLDKIESISINKVLSQLSNMNHISEKIQEICPLIQNLPDECAGYQFRKESCIELVNKLTQILNEFIELLSFNSQ